MASRGIFTKKNGQWVPVDAPSVNESGTWTNIKSGYTNVNGVWKQFWPRNVIANILIAGGGGGGGVGYGWEGGGGGGAGGVIYQSNVTLSATDAYTAIVGNGGATNNNGGDTWFGLGSPAYTVTAVDVPVYAGTYPVYNGFLNTYGVWTNPDFASPVGTWVAVNYTANIPLGQNYTLRVSGDNHIRVTINGNLVGANDNWATYNDSTISLSAGLLNIFVQALNDGGPALFAAALYDPLGNVVWSTRNTTIVTTSIWPLASGGGTGGWGVPYQTAGNGGSGGGGCGYVVTKGGGTGIPGQGNNGGTGIWQGDGQAGGGGGGGAGSAGNSSNGNQGGDGGQGVTYLGLTIGGGGAGGYGNQGPGGTGPGGNASAGGGAGNGGNGVDGTGGGGGGGEHNSDTNGGTGGAGGVYIQYPAPNAFFTGGTITVNNGIVTHAFTSAGTFTLAGL
jgi:hypothetical protein